MRWKFGILIGAGLASLLSGCSSWRVDKAARVATASTAQWLCGSAFVSHLDPAVTFAEQVLPLPGMSLVSWGLGYRVDRERREVTSSLAGAFESRSVYRDRLGCLVLTGDDEPPPIALPPPAPAKPALLAPIAGPDPVAPADPRLREAIAQAFGAPEGSDPHHTKALLVMRDGKVLGERYAPGIGVQTPLLGFSMNKSLMNALVGALVQQGRLDVLQPAPLAAWRTSSDAHRLITVDQLLRQNTGLDLPQTQSGFDASSQIMFTVRDKAAVSAAAPLLAPPGTQWNYTDPHFLLLSRVLRDAVGGDAASVLRFAQAALFDPLGMRSVTMEFDATGTPVGAATTYATARDWARLGQLYLDDGVVGGQRILPPGWVRYTTTPTPGTGYGAGFWLNSVDGQVPGWGIPWGLPHAPRDTYFARGFLGQFVVVIPSQRLVIVRLGTSQVYTRDGNIAVAMDRWVAGIVAALREGT